MEIYNKTIVALTFSRCVVSFKTQTECVYGSALVYVWWTEKIRRKRQATPKEKINNKYEASCEIRRDKTTISPVTAI